jgi:catechol 2,3-dioxygenase-like lactoylglutathione lyase family enzyme
MELSEVIVYVRDMERAVRFYRETLGIEPDFESPHWTTLHTGFCTLALHLASSDVPPDPTFLVTDAEAERARLAAAGVEVSELREPAPGVRVFDLRDPDGNRLSIESRELVRHEA